MSALLELRGLTVSYGAAPVVTNLNLDVAQGELVAFLGANGAGKSTTLSAIAGLVSAQAGSIHLLGKDLTSRSAQQMAARYGVVLVPESRSVFNGLTAGDHVRLIPGLGSNGGWKTIVKWFPELEPLRTRRAGVMSGGEQQMLGIGCALLRRPTLLMLDELSLGLAPLIVQRVMDAVADIARAEGIAVLLVEQFAHLALAATERCYVMRLGEITFEGNSATLARDPELLRASYLGST